MIAVGRPQEDGGAIFLSSSFLLFFSFQASVSNLSFSFKKGDARYGGTPCSF